jgi:peptidyl-prolyl cis-trans isomerase C
MLQIYVELAKSLKRVELGTIDVENSEGKKLMEKFKISMAKMPNIVLFKHTETHPTPIMEGTIATTKVLKKRLKRALKDLEKGESGKFLKTTNPPDIIKEWDEVRASHILVKTEDQCYKLKKRIADGEEFGEVAKKYSSCPSREKGGDLNWFGKGMMAAPFEQVCFYQDINVVHGPVQTKFGWHLILITDRKQNYDEKEL